MVVHFAQDKGKKMKFLRNITLAYAVGQIFLLVVWLIPNSPLTGMAWGLIFLPSFIYLGFALLTAIAVVVIFILGFMAWAVSENTPRK